MSINYCFCYFERTLTFVNKKNNYSIYMTYVTVDNICHFLRVYIKMKWNRCQQKIEIK